MLFLTPYDPSVMEKLGTRVRWPKDPIMEQNAHGLGDAKLLSWAKVTVKEKTHNECITHGVLDSLGVWKWILYYSHQ